LGSLSRFHRIADINQKKPSKSFQSSGLQSPLPCANQNKSISLHGHCDEDFFSLTFYYFRNNFALRFKAFHLRTSKLFGDEEPMDIPTKITPCPIVEAIVELRFEADLPDEAVFGVIYSSFRNETGEIEKLPILQLPEALRSTDPNLIYKPHYRLRKGEYTVQIGPKVFSFANIEEYVGWNTFSTEIGNRFEKLFKLGIIKSIGRFGLRYINLFSEMNIYEKSTLKIHLGESNQYGNQINLTMAMPMGGFLSKLVMVNNAEVKLQSREGTVKGSLIDIDVALEKPVKIKKVREIVEQAHNEEKKLFFSLLNPDFLETLNPEY